MVDVLVANLGAGGSAYRLAVVTGGSAYRLAVVMIGKEGEAWKC
jgi:hypothetical protein